MADKILADGKQLVDLGGGVWAEKVVAVSTTGTDISGGGGGGGAVTIADNADTNAGALADAAVAAGAAGSISAKLRAISRDIVANIVLKAGTAIIGQVGIDQTTDGTTNKVNTELPAAVLAADGLALPTAPQVQALLVAADRAGGGTPVNLLKSHTFTGDNAATDKALLVKASLVTGQEGFALSEGAAATDGNGGTRALQVAPYLYNGASFDRPRNNIDLTLLASAARTTTQTSADLVNYNADALSVVIDVTAYTAGGLTVTIDRKDSASGKYINMLTSALLAATGTVILQVGPVLPAVANLVALTYLPRIFRIVVTASDATSITYSVGYGLVRAR